MIKNVYYINEYRQMTEYKPLAFIRNRSEPYPADTCDFLYKFFFRKKYISDNYINHVTSDFKNCAFCANLYKSPENKSMLFCSVSGYPGQAPLLPDILSFDNTIPWFYRQPCAKFRRLNKKNYLRNFFHAFSEITIMNCEYLEAVTYGLSRGERPCYICASLNRSIYNRCFFKAGYNTKTPCRIISNKLNEYITGTT